MSYVATDYDKSTQAPEGKWACAPGSGLGPFDSLPPDDVTGGPKHYCGQCVSYVKVVCPTLPATSKWVKGAKVFGSAVAPGTVIATFDSQGKYNGHAAIYVSQDKDGIDVWDQWVTQPNPKAVGPRTLKKTATGLSNNPANFYVVE